MKIYFQVFSNLVPMALRIFNDRDTLRWKHLKRVDFVPRLSYAVYLFHSRNISKSRQCLSRDTMSVSGFYLAYQHLFKTCRMNPMVNL